MQNTCKMPTLQIRDLPEGLYEELKNSAQESRRSLTQEVIHLIDVYLNNKKENLKLEKRKKANLKKILSLRKEVNIKLDTQDIVNLVREDRDK
jgi:plasmid stability protein